MMKLRGCPRREWHCVIIAYRLEFQAPADFLIQAWPRAGRYGSFPNSLEAPESHGFQMRFSLLPESLESCQNDILDLCEILLLVIVLKSFRTRSKRVFQRQTSCLYIIVKGGLCTVAVTGSMGWQGGGGNIMYSSSMITWRRRTDSRGTLLILPQG